MTLTRIDWDLWLGIFGLRSLAWDPWLAIFGLGSLAWDFWLGIFGLGSLAWDLWLRIFGLGRSRPRPCFAASPRTALGLQLWNFSFGTLALELWLWDLSFVSFRFGNLALELNSRTATLGSLAWDPWAPSSQGGNLRSRAPPSQKPELGEPPGARYTTSSLKKSSKNPLEIPKGIPS